MMEQKPTTPDAAPKSELEIMQETRSRLKAENDAIEQELLRRERLRAESIRGGGNVMTPPPVQETAHDKWKREAKKRYEGTGLDPTW